MVKITQFRYLIMRFAMFYGLHYRRSYGDRSPLQNVYVITSKSSVDDCFNELCRELFDGISEVQVP